MRAMASIHAQKMCMVAAAVWQVAEAGTMMHKKMCMVAAAVWQVAEAGAMMHKKCAWWRQWCGK
ncbi:hypothetical protein [Cohnella rhizosphaerae]|uniref:Uncharacterized protein n=1 Tax=Cohnella rhizosphaerae TaxID=1457232 RepID=A0A9X4QTY2_9BACL|nr:hypothetical protein [Cohnella rhizosphaerae]MDG0809907.1 hypothetical protein [Cohnella rhizosphaerae]